MESKLPKEKPKSLALRRNLERLQLELRNVIQGVKKNNGNWGLPRYGVGEELLHQTEPNASESCTGEIQNLFSFLLLLGRFLVFLLIRVYQTEIKVRSLR